MAPARRLILLQPQHREALTPDENFMITPHTACKDLFVATCGSFHGWKFLPVIGKYVVQMLDGKLAPDLREKWAWDRKMPSPDKNHVWPRRDLGEFC
jgi:glycine/D-amino acid oxidase-like deaminating enzyme